MRFVPTFGLAILLCFITTQARAGYSPMWIDITGAPYNADYKCTAGTDDGPAINQAIADASTYTVGNNAGGWVIYFPPGCYLINTQIVDNKSAAAGITYLGYGRVELRAASTLTGSIIKLGDDSNTIIRRHFTNLYFECNPPSGTQPNISGIIVDGLEYAQFDDIMVHGCPAAGIATIGNNNNNYGNTFEGGGVSTSSAAGKGILLTYATNNWTFKGTKILNTSGASTGIGVEFEAAGNTCLGCDIEGWQVGLAISPSGLDTDDGVEIAGGYFENNTNQHILIGYAGAINAKARGVSIHGVYFNNTRGSSGTQTCIEIDQADGFTISGNEFKNCEVYNIRALADGSNQGADNGLIGPNNITGTATNSLLGSNISYISNGQLTQINSTSNCSSAVNPASCGSDASGSVVIAAGSTSVTVDTIAVTANSQILVTFDSSLGSKLGVTCNTAFNAPLISARTAGTSFNIAVTVAPTTNPACYSFIVVN